MIRKLLVTLWFCIAAIYCARAQYTKFNFDTSVKPEKDFYRYVNGTWLKTAEIPASEMFLANYHEVRNRNRDILKSILDDVSKQKKQKGTIHQLVGDFYASGMDMAKRDLVGLTPIKPDLERIESMQSKEQVIALIAEFNKMGISSPLFFYTQADAKNSKFNSAHMWEGGTNLPSRDYYIGEDERSKTIRSKYKDYIGLLFELSGTEKTKAAESALKVLAMEVRFAQAHRTMVQNRNPEKIYNKLSIAELNQRTYSINWNEFFQNAGAKDIKDVVVAQPEFLSMLDRMLEDVPLADWKLLMKWNLLNSSAPYLDSRFDDANFNFFRKELAGVPVKQERWKTIQQAVDNSLQEPLGQLYVERAFKPEAKARAKEMIEFMREAFAERIKRLDWMSDYTKEQALTKLKKIAVRVGYPDAWRDYSALDVRPDDYAGNIRRASVFSSTYQNDQIGKPVDTNQWGMSPSTVNAYYNPLNNEVVFPAGILQPPLFDPNADDAWNYGSMGAVIGHEISHGFDNRGSQFDPDGNLKVWWKEDDRKKFDEKARQLTKQYDAYTVLDTVHVNGQLTLGENIADLGGIAMAYDALQRAYAKKGRPKKVNGLSGEQRFFVGYTTGWRMKFRDTFLMQMIKTNTHTPGEFRANGVLYNFPPFFEAFDIPKGSSMRNEKVLEIW